MQRLAANTGKVDPRLTIEWPKVGRPIWGIFNSLGRASGMGMSAISQQEIAAWQQNHSIKLTPWELEMIAMFDQIALEAIAKQGSKS